MLWLYINGFQKKDTDAESRFLYPLGSSSIFNRIMLLMTKFRCLAEIVDIQFDIKS